MINFAAHQMKTTIIIILFFNILQLHSQFVRYSTAWFGPNANPVPEFNDARIPAKTTVDLMADYYFGYGDRTTNGYFRIEIPLLPHRVSIKLWSSVLEKYRVTAYISDLRGMSGALSGKANGDLYVQTRALLLRENMYKPDLILNITLKTTSGTGFSARRYFDTPGYYFDVEAGKSFKTDSRVISEIRPVINYGFFSWETTGGKQNDASIYGLKLIMKNKTTALENTLSGYNGWMHKHPAFGDNYGDNPLVYSIKIIQNINEIKVFGQYQYGIRDYPYHQLRVGFTFEIPFLTPSYQ
jgi:hypothetical protein